jgi:hypothetical protein
MAASIVQSVTVSQSLTGSITVTAGNTIVVMIMDFNPNSGDTTGVSVAPISDTLNGSASYTGPITVGGDIGFNGSLSGYYFTNTAGGSTTVSVNENGGATPDATRVYWAIVELSGVGALDGTATLGQGNAAFTSFGSGLSNFDITGPVSNTTASGVLLGMGYTNSSVNGITVGSGFTDLGGLPNLSIGSAVNGIRFEGEVVNATGVSALWNCADSTQNFSAIVFFFDTAGPTINTQPVQTTAYAGQTATFTVSATTSAGSLTYQWTKNGSNVGTNSNSYTTPVLTNNNNLDIYQVSVTDSNGTTVSNTVYLIVIPTGILAWIT